MENTTATAMTNASSNEFLLMEFPTVALVFLTLLAICILSGNILVLCSVQRFAALRTPTNMFLCGLACSDFTVGLATIFVIVDSGTGTPLSGFSYLDCLGSISITLLPAATTEILLLGKYFSNLILFHIPPL